MSTKKYFYDPSAETLTILELDDEGEVASIVELSDPYVTTELLAEDADHMLPAEIPESKPRKEKAQHERSGAEADWRKKPRGPRRCKNCGQTGHNTKTCPEAGGMVKTGAPAMPSLAAPDLPPTKSLRQQIAEQRSEGVTLEEMYELFPDRAMAEIAAVYRNIEEEEARI